ncbi:helix-turn-helix domain-containing protein [Flavobacterium sp. '19STA2R22 D10 B1']|uniref:AraC family transcriptional regulator n=1 Tax=Flavobacterium aerium TaxID=3037261 RepID=UPI00278C73C9|nr:helix-turn-helix domain-containing protein [Flavobacterium sp. '19STA2R22 D10 B1']
MQLNPSIVLSGIIKHYLFLDTQAEEVKKLRLFSDGNMGLVFSFKNNLIQGFTTQNIPEYLPDTFVYGQLNSFKNLYCQGDTSLLIVVFHAYGLNNVLNIASNELKDNIIQTTDLFGTDATNLQEQLMEQITIQGKINSVEDFFRKLVSRKSTPSPSLVITSIDFIVKNKGIVSIPQLTAFTGCSERKLERVFTEKIGVSPKKFSGIVKLHTFLKSIKSNKEKLNLTSLAYETGYYDQPNLIREFKKYTGLTPSQYLHKVDPLAVNFLELS